MSQSVADLQGASTGTFALRRDGSVWGWGEIAGANLLERWQRDPTMLPFVLEPVQVVDGGLAGLQGVKQLAGADLVFCALRADDQILCWGNLPAAHGAERPQVDRAVPIEDSPVAGTVQLAVSDDSICRLGLDGTVACLGANDLGQLGDGTRNDRFVMSPVALPGPAVEVASGIQHTCARLADGSLWCWGANQVGQLGTGDEVERLVPTRVKFE
jgi:alpha-tubulin suppressor-like RCC1 family protein